MKQNNKDEKRHRRQRTAARKRKERSEYREKYKIYDRQQDELRYYNNKLESGIKKYKILSCVSFLCIFVFSIIPIFSVTLLPEPVVLNKILLILFIVSVFMAFWFYMNYLNRCYFSVSLAEHPALPVGVCVPKYVVDRESRICVEDIFEELNKKDVFTQCSAKRIVITNDSDSSWIIVFILSFIPLYFSFDSSVSIWLSETFLLLLWAILCFVASVFLYVYGKKKTFIIDREEKTITIPPVSRFGKNKVLPYQQVVVAFRSGLINIREKGVSGQGMATGDYLSLTAKEDLPLGPSLGFRCNASTQYRFALFICEYMNVSDLNEMPDIEGFEDIINKIKAEL